MLFHRGKRQTKRTKEQNLSTGMLVVVIVMSLSAFAFVGTTVAWFNASIRGTPSEITTGRMAAVLRPDEGTKATASFGTTYEQTSTEVKPEKIRFYQVKDGAIGTKPAETWVPGEIYASQPMHVSNDGDISFNLMLAIERQTVSADSLLGLTESDLHNAGFQSREEAAEYAQRYINHIRYRIVSSDRPVEQFAAAFAADGQDQSGIFKTDVLDKGETSASFRILARVDDQTQINDLNLTRQLNVGAPFRFFVLIKQAGVGEFPMESLVSTCLGTGHQPQAKTGFAKGPTVQPPRRCIDDDNGYWQGHRYFCAICGEEIPQSAGGESLDEVISNDHYAFMQELANENILESSLVQTGNVTLEPFKGGYNVYCRQCLGTKIGMVLNMEGGYTFYWINEDGQNVEITRQIGS